MACAVGLSGVAVTFVIDGLTKETRAAPPPPNVAFEYSAAVDGRDVSAFLAAPSASDEQGKKIPVKRIGGR